MSTIKPITPVQPIPKQLPRKPKPQPEKPKPKKEAAWSVVVSPHHDFCYDVINKHGSVVAGALYSFKDASLVAAAPNMLEALIEFIECGPNAGHNQELIEQCLSAIAKATGKKV